MNCLKNEAQTRGVLQNRKEKKEMERLKQKDCKIDFLNEIDMQNFLQEMLQSDEEVSVKLNSITTYTKDEELLLEAKTTDGLKKTMAVWPFAIKSLEKRSGDTAKGHALMTNEQILNSMNNYWGLHSDKEVSVARIRGDKILGMGSAQYEFIDQEEMLKAVINWLEMRHPGKYTFLSGYYTHQLTYAKFRIDDSISASYKTAWRKAGLPESMLKNSSVEVTVMTDDTAECAAKAIIQMDVSRTRYLLGNPIEVIHRSGHGGIENFTKELDKADMSIQTELDALASLMFVKLSYPESAAVAALKKAGVHKISKKACKELTENMFFGTNESAYIVYLYLHSILDTSYGSALSEERKLRIVCALRTLLKEDWKKLDVPGAEL